MDVKLQVLRDVENSEESLTLIARKHNIHESTVRSIVKNKIKIQSHSMLGKAGMKAKRIVNPTLKKTENVLVLWLEDMNSKSLPVDTQMIKIKALNIYDLIGKDLTPPPPTFRASNGWFQKFKKRHALRNIQIHGESASADVEAAERFPAEFKQIIQEGGYNRHQLFNADETRLYCKRMPKRSFVVEMIKRLPGRKADKKAFTLMFCSNASGSVMLKPLLINNVKTPRPLKNVNKETLPVVYEANRKGYMTSILMEDWFHNHFVPRVQQMCEEKNLAFKAILLLDNAPSHPKDLDHPNVKVIYLPPNTTSLIQPQDQGIIASFKLHYLRTSYTKILRSMDDDGMSLMDAWRAFNIRNCMDSIDLAVKNLSTDVLRNCWNKILGKSAEDNIQLNDSDEVIGHVIEIGERFGVPDLQKPEVLEILEEEETTIEEILAGIDDEENSNEVSLCQPTWDEFEQQLTTLNTLMHFVGLDEDTQRAARMHGLLQECESLMTSWKQEAE